ncbi:hypothetical protein BA062_33060 [Prauserella flavalba]|uniref:Uncharacterized protein n=2 Tax=Prauserella flavalba TaxID=1477506 RepID=A0A318LB06_9PSEU|nr:hypothetical protein BA062_33060 [Prauserella flavalba]
MVATALAFPLAFGAAGLASADEYGSETTVVGPDGVATEQVAAGSGSEEQGVSYVTQSQYAGADGAASDLTYAGADGDDAAYYTESAAAGADGASSSSTWASTDDADDAEAEPSDVYDDDWLAGDDDEDEDVAASTGG